MRLLARTWIAAARAHARLARAAPVREQLVRRYAPGRSFADVGCMWGVHGHIAFLAEESGATAVTGVDVMAETEQYAAEHGRRGSAVRFVHGDLHEPQVISEIGGHQVVWCSGVLYHAPNPLLTLERLYAITDDVLILATETIPEVPGLAQACVFFPGLPAPDRRIHGSARPGTTALGVSIPFERAQSYGAWWWGMSRSAVRGMLHAAGFDVIEEYGNPLHATLVAKPLTR
jgi:hypothetical protein